MFDTKLVNCVFSLCGPNGSDRPPASGSFGNDLRNEPPSVYTLCRFCPTLLQTLDSGKQVDGGDVTVAVERALPSHDVRFPKLGEREPF
jgi:hypothetical protein